MTAARADQRVKYHHRPVVGGSMTTTETHELQPDTADPAAGDVADRAQRARRALVRYLVLTFAVSWAIQADMILAGGPIEDHGLESFALMWTPGWVALGLRLVTREGFGDVSFRIGKAGGVWPWLVAWLSPLAVGLAAYGLAWGTGLADFEAPATSGIGLGGMSPIPRFALTVGLTLLIGPVLAGISAVGEEIGWRGYMLTRLIDARLSRPILLSGVVWGLWHLPIILSGQYAAGPYPMLSALLFLISIIAGGALAAYARLETGSVWAAALFHASWNATIQGPFDHFTVGGDASRTTSIWIGESGILVMLASVLVAAVVFRRGVTARRAPNERPMNAALDGLA